MRKPEYRRRWEESQMDIAALEAEIARTLTRVRRINADLYEGVMGEPPPEYAPRAIRRAS